MIGVGLVLLVIGVVTLFFMPWVGIPAAIVGIVLVVLFLLAVGGLILWRAMAGGTPGGPGTPSPHAPHHSPTPSATVNP